MGTPGPGWVSSCLGSWVSARPLPTQPQHPWGLTRNTPLHHQPYPHPSSQKKQPCCKVESSLAAQFLPKQAVAAPACGSPAPGTGWLNFSPRPLLISHGWDPSQEGGRGVSSAEVHTNHQASIRCRLWAGRSGGAKRAVFPAVPGDATAAVRGPGVE